MSCKRELAGLFDELTGLGGPYEVKHRGACLYLLLDFLERGMLLSIEKKKLTAMLALFIPVADVSAASSSKGRFFWFAQYGQN